MFSKKNTSCHQHDKFQDGWLKLPEERCYFTPIWKLQSSPFVCCYQNEPLCVSPHCSHYRFAHTTNVSSCLGCLHRKNMRPWPPSIRAFAIQLDWITTQYLWHWEKTHVERLFLIFPSSTSPSPFFVLLVSSSSISVLDCVVIEWKSAWIDTLTQTLIGNSELSAGRLGGKSCPNLSCLGGRRLDLGGVMQQIRVYWMCLYKCALWCVRVMWFNLCKLQLRFTNEGPFPHFSGAFKRSLRGCRHH